MSLAFEAARYFLLTVLSIKVAEGVHGVRILPQNPLDIATLINNITSLGITVIVTIILVLILFIILLRGLRKRKEAKQIVYVPAPYYYGQQK